MEPAPHSWPESMVSRSTGKAPGLALHLLTTVLLKFRLDVTTELVELTACGVVRPRQITSLKTSALADEDEQPPRQRQTSSVNPRFGSGQRGIGAVLEGALHLVREPFNTARVSRRSSDREEAVETQLGVNLSGKRLPVLQMARPPARRGSRR